MVFYPPFHSLKMHHRYATVAQEEKFWCLLHRFGLGIAFLLHIRQEILNDNNNLIFRMYPG